MLTPPIGMSFGLLVLMIRANVLVSCSLEKLWALFLQYVVYGGKISENLLNYQRKYHFFIKKCKTLAYFA